MRDGCCSKRNVLQGLVVLEHIILDNPCGNATIRSMGCLLTVQ